MIFFVNVDHKLVNNIPTGNGVPLDYISGNFPIISIFKPPEIQEISEITDELK